METSSTDFVLYDCIICGRRDITAVQEPIHATTSKKETAQKSIDVTVKNAFVPGAGIEPAWPKATRF